MPVASIIGGLIGQSANAGASARVGQATSQAQKMAQDAADNALSIRYTNQGELTPWRAAGTESQNLIAQLMGLGHYTPDGQGHGGVRMDNSNWQGDQANAFSRFQASPDYNFRLQQGQKALDQSAASRGMLLSGKQAKASQEFGGNLASGEYNNWFNKLNGVGTQGLASSVADTSNNLGGTAQQNNALLQGANFGMAGAQQQGAFDVAGANALASGINSGFQNLFSILGAYGPNLSGSAPGGSSGAVSAANASGSGGGGSSGAVSAANALGLLAAL